MINYKCPACMGNTGGLFVTPGKAKQANNSETNSESYSLEGHIRAVEGGMTGLCRPIST